MKKLLSIVVLLLVANLFLTACYDKYVKTPDHSGFAKYEKSGGTIIEKGKNNKNDYFVRVKENDGTYLIVLVSNLDTFNKLQEIDFIFYEKDVNNIENGIHRYGKYNRE